jgi:hypothetical protein
VGVPLIPKLDTAGARVYNRHMDIFGIFRQDARLRHLEDRIETLERTLKNSTLDWDELYEKMRRLTGRVEKRAARDKDTAGEDAARGDSAAASPASVANDVFRRRYGGLLSR